MFGYNPPDDQHFLYNLYGAKYSVNGYYGKYHTGIDMYGVPGRAEKGEDKLSIQSNTELAKGLGVHLHIEVQNGKAKAEAALPTISAPIDSISPYEYL